MPDSGMVCLVGASTRAIAFSALRAGLRPACLDLFADADLRAVAPVTRFAEGHYPHAALDWLARSPESTPWAFAGGLENHPALVRQLSSARPLWGCGAAALARARSPVHVASVLAAAGLRSPTVRADPPRDSARPWLVKPLAGAGGHAVRFWVPGEAFSSLPVCYQEFVAGESVSAVFLAGREGVRLLGVTRQLVGRPWLNARPFQYCGTVGPLEVSESVRRQFDAAGRFVARDAHLRGLFGIDAVLSDDVVWPVEVNPRYTASVEVLEHATGESAFGLHRDTCQPAWSSGVFQLSSWGMAGARHELPTPPPTPPGRRGKVLGKAVLFTPRPVAFPAVGPWTCWLDKLRQSPSSALEWPPFADIPPAGTSLAAGAPVLTVFAESDTPDGCEAALKDAAAEVAAALAG